MKISPKEFTNRDLNVQLRYPVISWSSMNAFLMYDKNVWYDQYVLGKRMKPNPVMLGGIEVGERIVSDSSFLPFIPRPEIFEKELVGVLGDIKITGHIDGWSESVPGIDEYKTSSNPNRWTQDKVDEWGQITFYCLLVYIHYKIEPEKLRLRLFYIPMIEKGDFSLMQEGEPIMFETKRTMVDILNFSALIKKTHKEMNEFIESKK